MIFRSCFLLLFVLVGCKSQFQSYEVQEILSNDTVPRVTRIVNYDRSNRIVREEYKDFHRSPSEQIMDLIRYYDYKGDRLIKRTTYQVNVDSTVTLFIYDDKGLLIQDKSSSKPSWKPNWSDTAVAHYKYDDSGNKIERKVTSKNLSERYTFLWQYDSLNRAVKIEAFDYNHLLSEKSYFYTDTGYFYFETSQPSEKDQPDFIPQVNFFRINEFGLDTEELVIDENGIWRTKRELFYDDKQNVIKEKYYEIYGSRWLEHIYIFK
jgi:hypothetical protein